MNLGMVRKYNRLVRDSRYGKNWLGGKDVKKK